MGCVDNDIRHSMNSYRGGDTLRINSSFMLGFTVQRTQPGPPKKTDTLKFKEMFSLLIGLQTAKASLLCCKLDL